MNSKKICKAFHGHFPENEKIKTDKVDTLQDQQKKGENTCFQQIRKNIKETVLTQGQSVENTVMKTVS